MTKRLLTGSVGMVAISLVLVAAQAGAQGTNRTNGAPSPAQVRYGFPQTPTQGAAKSYDLTKPITLNEAVAIALLRQNSIAIAKAGTDASRAQVVQARAPYFPQITPGYTYTSSVQPISGAGAVGGTFSGENVTDQITLRQTIWDGGKREANLQQARNSLDASQFNLGNTRQSVILAVTQDYFTLLRDQKLIQVQQVSVDQAKQTLDSINEQVAVGNAAKTAPYQAESDYANAQVALIQAQNVAEVDDATLKNAMGVSTSQPLILAPPNLAPVIPTPDPRGLESYVQQAFQNRLDLKQQQSLINAQTDALRVARLQAGIGISASVDEGYQFQPTSGEQRAFVVSFTYPLFDGGSSKAAVRAAEAQLAIQERTLDQLEQNARLAVEQDYLTRELSRQQVDAANKAALAGEQNWKAAEGELKFGVINILDSINARLQLVTAQVNQVNALYNFYIANARLLRDIGSNDPEFASTMPVLKGAAATTLVASVKKAK